MSVSRIGRVAAVLATFVIAGCGKGEQEEPPKSRAEEERTVVTLQSYVYATADENSFRVAERIRDQVKSAFGALKSLRVTGSNQNASNTANDELYREPLVLVDAAGREVIVMRVWFRYVDEVVASQAVQRNVPLLVGGLHLQDDAHFTQIVTECTPNTARERELRGRLQSAFDGSIQSCQDAILAEQAKIDAARVRLDEPEDEIVPEEFLRVYVPVVARVMARKASQMGRYPRFEPVVPQAGRGMAVASAPGKARPRGRSAESDDGAGELFDAPAAAPKAELGSDVAGDRKAELGSDVAGDREKEPALIVPAVGAGGPGRAGPAAEEAADPNAPPDPQMDVPVVAAAPAAANAKAAAPVQPRGDVESSFAWEDLLDKKFILLWISLFSLYPLLKRRQ
ncbi:MAG: hypothetical protein U0441_37485 [Polyangiaceae bacterium]